MTISKGKRIVRSRSRSIAVLLAGLGAVCGLTMSFAYAADAQGVRVWEEKTVIPTYLAGAPEPNPMFFFGRQSQGAQGPVYPYPMYDSITGQKVDKTYTLVHLENEYIRLGILPELGGRLFEGVDKTNDYNFVYRQHVIKPALIGLIGAWISGGVEWNIPHHHRASTFSPVQYSVEENADGSKTVWVGELELRHQMRWAVGYTLRPGKAYLEATVKILNQTPAVQSMLCFANVAVHANENYQVIFPPGTQYGTGHGKHTFTQWPISDTIRGGPKMETGTDISWYKNHITANSVFAWNYEDDFMAGYDHGKQAGTMTIADHNVVPGKKFFTWGNAPMGRRWDHVLTDDDGPYLEMMVGGYSDNQPDYSWLQPYEERTFAINWYPFREIGGVKMANLDAAVNLDVADGTAKVGFYTTSAHAAAKVTLKAGQKTLLEETVAINPGKPFTKNVQLPAGTDPHDLVASMSDAGEELVSYTPVRREPMAQPKPVTPPPAPADVKTNEELYLTGLRAQQFHSPSVDPEPYWQEALRRDPSDVRVNTVLGITRYKRARYAEAEKYLRTAIERATDRYTAPKDGEALYYLGAVLKAQGREKEARTQFYKATWSAAWKTAGYFSMAQIAAARGDMADALFMVNRSIDSNATNIRALNLKAAVLRHLGRPNEALQVLSTANRVNPLDVQSMAEHWLSSKDPAPARTMASAMNTHPETAQETAAAYLDAGLWSDGRDVLQQMTAAAPDKTRIHPMAYYYLGFFEGKLGQPQNASAYFKQAQSMPPDYVFPFQNEAIDVLRAAIQADSKDARAPYYLGNLLYDQVPEEATKLWEASAAIDPGFAITHRNLAVAYMHQKPEPALSASIAELEKAVSADRKYALHFTELDELYEQAGTPIEKRLQLFEKNQEVVAQRDDSLNREVALLISAGKYDSAIAAMTNRPFAAVEGANLNVSEHWTDAHVLRGQAKIQAKQYKEALADFDAASHVPANLPTGLGFGEGASGAMRAPEIGYWTGVAYEAMAERDKASASWRSGSTRSDDAAGNRRRREAPVALKAQAYYEALCLQKLGQSEKATALLKNLVDANQQALGSPGETGAVQARMRTANAHYLSGLGYLGMNDRVKANAELSEALRMSPDLIGARTALASMR
jgi:tetratricopeptide (TPR) repeat protein